MQDITPANKKKPAEKSRLTLTQRIVMSVMAVIMLLGSLGPVVQSYMN